MALNDGFWYIWVILFGLLIAMSIWRCQRRNAMLAAAQQEMVVIPTNQSINPPPGFVPMYVNGTIMYVPQYAYGQPVEQAYNPSINQPMSPVIAAVPISYEGQPINQSVNQSINPQPFTGQTYHLDDAPPAKEAGTYALPPQPINQSINQPSSPVNPAYHSPPPSYNPARRGEL